ncbi:MAG: hypothetical protein C0518_08280 [Opitutus sp.]|nr:hypothetical protein [Opitutus sp.]
MKILRSALACVALSVAGARAGAEAFDEIGQPDGAFARVALSDSDIETLVAPIALYPDPLLALILPAATRPSDIVLAARFLDRGGHPDAATAELWDDSVKALTRYREVLTYLDTHLEWTRRLGECFLDQPDAVMDAVQAIRARARNSGLLTNTPQQEVIYEDEQIHIVPAQPTVIYVPRYDPQILYYTSGPRYYAGSFLTFGIGYGIGSWLSYDCDWRSRHVRIVQRPPSWYYRPDWRRRHASSVAGARWVPRYDRHNYDHRRADFDRRRSGNHHRAGSADDRRWNSNSSQATAGWNNAVVSPTPSRDRRDDWQRSPRRPEAAADRGRTPRPDHQGRARRENLPPRATAPAVVASAPPAVTAPESVTHAPAAAPTSNRTWTNQRPAPHRDRDERPRFDGARPDRPRADANNRPRREDYQPRVQPPPSAASVQIAPPQRNPAPAPRYSPPARSNSGNATPRESRGEGRDQPRHRDRGEDGRRELN